nr:5-methyltetrahydropteroyltriglutamate--homocysteine methyltransferase [Pelagibacteraceae bacterium]
MLTTVIGAFPKPSYLKITDWFNAAGGTDTANPTKLYEDEINKMGDEAEQIFLKATKQVILDQEECGIDILTDGEVRRENYIHYHCRHLEGVDFNTLTEKVARTGNYKCWL